MKLLTKLGYFAIGLLFIGGFTVINNQSSLLEGIVAFGVWQGFTFLIFALYYSTNRGGCLDG